ncbi:MAG: response regulator, partial [Thermodesulfovibrionales bacterium]
GTGLGLSVTYGIISSHDGWISFYSEKDKGTEFRVYLPVMEAPGVRDAGGRDINIYSTVSPLTSFPYILLVDDEEMIRDVGRSIIESLGYRVITASNGKEAVEIYKDKGKEISLIIMDMVMPVMDGMTAFREIKRINPNAKVIISSGYSADKMDILEKEGFAGLINKPYRLSDVAETIRKVLEWQS